MQCYQANKGGDWQHDLLVCAHCCKEDTTMMEVSSIVPGGNMPAILGEQSLQEGKCWKEA